MSNLYIRVRTGFYANRKTIRLRLKIGDDAYWIPPRLWAYAAENQPDGDISGYSSEELAELLGCSKYATSILQALKDSEFVSNEGKIHDWAEHNGYHEKYSARAKTAAAARWAKVPAPEMPKAQPAASLEIESGKGKEESGDKHCSSNATSIPDEPKKRVKVAAELPSEAVFWNANCGVLPKIASVSPGRMKHLQSRRQDLFWMTNFEQAVVRLTKSAFCTGTNDRQWKADFDFILQSDAVAKIMEGKYDNKAPLGTNGQPKSERNLDVWHIGEGKYNLTTGPKREQFPNDGSFQSHLRMYESWQANRLRQKESK